MRGRDHHIPIERLTALAFIVRAPEDTSAANGADQRALTHLSHCDRCSEEFVRLTADAEGLRELAFARADEVFDDAMLDAQRVRILDRLAHLGQAARVLNFPRRSRDVAMPVSTSSRRWISVAAAAGLIIGLLAGQMLHFVPSGAVSMRDQSVALQSGDRSPAVVRLPASASLPALSEDELMEEVEAAVQLRRAQSLRALDALTPTGADLLAMGR